jgi:hypothetical protein
MSLFASNDYLKKTKIIYVELLKERHHYLLLANVFLNTAEIGVVAELLIQQKWSKVK